MLARTQGYGFASIGKVEIVGEVHEGLGKFELSGTANRWIFRRRRGIEART